MKDFIYYFAYGSNMDDRQMFARCPGSEFHAIGFISDHELVFNLYSEMRKCGVANIRASSGPAVWGVIYKVPSDIISNLDRIEGFDPSRESHLNEYNRESREVQIDGRVLLCFVYIGGGDGDKTPSEHYRGQILYGAEKFGLPESYVQSLRKVSCQMVLF